MESSLVLLSRHSSVRASTTPDIQHNVVTAIPIKILALPSTTIASMHLRPSIGCLVLLSALGPSPLHAQTDQPSSTRPVTRAIAVYEWTGDLDSPDRRAPPPCLPLHPRPTPGRRRLSRPTHPLRPPTRHPVPPPAPSGPNRGCTRRAFLARWGGDYWSLRHPIRPHHSLHHRTRLGGLRTFPHSDRSSSSHRTDAPATIRLGAPGPDSRTRFPPSHLHPRPHRSNTKRKPGSKPT